MLPRTVALGLGSNLGSSCDHLRKALSEIKQLKFFRVKKVSSIYESDAQLPEKVSSDWNLKYLNAVVLLELTEGKTPLELLAEVKKIESKMGRKAGERWAPRLIDIDVLAWSGENFSSAQMNIPHASLNERPFALLPLLEVWPDYVVERPSWAYGWVQEKPFNTRVSRQFFWPRFVGILNVTPDSFSDGGNLLFNESALVHQLEKFSRDGAEVLDVGAESTRPQATPVAADEELKRLAWALSTIEKSGLSFKLSLDSRNPEVTAAVLNKYKIDFINDVTGLQNSKMVRLVKESNLPAFVMHSLDVPAVPKNI
ncbi:MAG: 2-amino-4-hydroxy-6-hydroxymethyldihydropteridine diphosphokinase, partial [Pseudobdellovibrio sp.]